MVPKSLDLKLARLRKDPASRDFILGDAKDADMARGIATAGLRRGETSPARRYRSLAEYREGMREIVRQGLVDIMLMSAHSSSILTIQERLFDDSPVTPAIRANDASDAHLARGSNYVAQPARPFRTALLDHVQGGHVDCRPEERSRGVNLGLYSVTFNNDLDLDLQTLAAYNDFRIEAERKGFRHFLEVFDPNCLQDPLDPQPVGAYLNDLIARTLAGVPDCARPLFLKMGYQGPLFTEELVNYDPALVIGVLGGCAGTTYDAFKLIAEAQKYGARAALFGRKINAAEHPLTMVEFLKRIVDGDICPEEAVRAYHGALPKLKLRPDRNLDDDLRLTDPCLRYLTR
jgi:hypothetical protein